MKILGVDPGLRTTGYGLILEKDKKVSLLELGIIQPNPKGEISQRLGKIHADLHDLVRKYQPDILILEKIYSHYKHPMTIGLLGHVRGVICLLCAQENITLVEHSPKRIRKALTGNGNATKNQVKRVLAGQFNLNEKKLTLDASDALALAVGYGHIHRRFI